MMISRVVQQQEKRHWRFGTDGFSRALTFTSNLLRPERMGRGIISRQPRLCREQVEPRCPQCRHIFQKR
uniref:Uncharacterized protein n=2 Tax=Physcomitrium patens TaxID=3218 RepID=A0A2K1IUT0_PHYPA|nr:hypothetical protein PHYPA_024978 [Physcomitrium patens]